MKYDARAEYPEGLVAQMRRRFPSPKGVREGFASPPAPLRELMERVNQAMLAGSLREALALRAQFAKAWSDAKFAAPGHAGYCIGGAFMAYTASPDATSFPSPESFGRALRRSNPRLSASRAEAFARDSLAANDCGDFDLAWTVLEEAIAYGRSPGMAVGTTYCAQVAGLDVFVVDDRVTVLADGEVSASCSLEGLRDLVETCQTRLEVTKDASGRLNSLLIISIDDESRRFVVPLEPLEVAS